MWASKSFVLVSKCFIFLSGAPTWRPRSGATGFRSRTASGSKRLRTRTRYCCRSFYMAALQDFNLVGLNKSNIQNETAARNATHHSYCSKTDMAYALSLLHTHGARFFSTSVVWQPGRLHRALVLKTEGIPNLDHSTYIFTLCGLLILINASRIFISSHFMRCISVVLFPPHPLPRPTRQRRPERRAGCPPSPSFRPLTEA